MWILVRAGARGSTRSSEIVVACPDGHRSDVPQLWEVRLDVDDGGAPAFATFDEAQVELVEQRRFHGATEQLQRGGGEHLVLLATAGQTEVRDPTGTWSRTLDDGDVMVLDGDDAEVLVVSNRGRARVDAVRFAPRSDQPLRWTPGHG